MENDDPAKEAARAEVNKPEEAAQGELSKESLDEVSGGLMWPLGSSLPKPRKENADILKPL